ncbi:lipoprotein-anchoring transpeptidase ErfK/SrfK [Sphingomonas zeicaulis]|uniref:L,D-transpeptidase family protein n=1 Tax=Sphingomonas zeicaulis TaxID=1632740 RepID=UPI003D2528B2
MKAYIPLIALVLLGGCEVSVKEPDAGGDAAAAAPAAAAPNPGAALLFADAPADASPAPGAQADPPALQLQVVLDRLGISPGVIDGKEGASLKLALRGFQASRGLTETGTLDDPTRAALAEWKDVPATRMVRIPAAFAAGPFVPNLPRETSAQADFPALGYRSLMEALAERFHTTPETLVALNGPTTKVGEGRVIRVPNVADIDPAALGEDERGWNRTLVTLAVPPKQPEATRIVVDKSEGVLRAYGADDKLLMQAPATMGSEHDPLPIGTWKVNGVSRNPDFHYNPKLFWDVSDHKEDKLIKPGPNSPVGVVWIDLSKEHYGIHGTSEPQTIGRSESHGCVRLTNWDVARLAQMVKGGITVVFQA